MFKPDPYVAECAAKAGPSPIMTLIRAAIEWQGWGAGSKAKPAYEAAWKIGSCLVALNGHPLMFKGGFNRDADAPVYPGSEGQPEIPDMLAVADAMLSPPLAALHGVLNRAVDDLRNYNFPAEDYADQAEADAARASAWAEVETVAAWLARLPDPPAFEDTADDLTPAHELPCEGGPVSITHAKPGDDRETVVERFATIAAAEAFLNLSAGIDPDDLAAGNYGINAPHGAGSDNEAIAMARRLGLIGPQDTDAAAAHRALTHVEP
jgi:hypothetical protein